MAASARRAGHRRGRHPALGQPDGVGRKKRAPKTFSPERHPILYSGRFVEAVPEPTVPKNAFLRAVPDSAAPTNAFVGAVSDLAAPINAFLFY